MNRLLIAVDESLKLGVSAEELSSVGSELAPADLQRFEEAKHCIELLDRMFRQHSRTDSGVPADVSLPLEGSSSSALQAFPSSSRYCLLELLGQGAMGIVYKVVDEQRNTIIAFKKLRENNPARVLRFKQEFRRLANVSHENVVTLFELAQADSDWFITMELVDGKDFLNALSLRHIPADLAESNGASTHALEELCTLFLQLAHGLEALHTAGILHRDLKPSNVLVTPDSRVVVIDFGLATSFDWMQLQATHLKEFAGTYAYMAPEQVACQSLTPASDWYSFGVMLYQAFTGMLPSSGPLSLVTRQYRQPPNLKQHLPDLPDGWNELCQSLLAPEPQARPAGHEIIHRLRELQRAIQKPAQDEFDNLRQATTNPREVRAFVGRQAELEQLHSAYRACLHRQPTVATIEGSSGIGKTTLVESFLNEVTAQVPNAVSSQSVPVVLRGRCHERESLPFKTLDSLVDSLCKYLSNCTDAERSSLLPQDMPLLYRVFPVLGTFASSTHGTSSSAVDADPVNLRRRAFEAFRELLLAIAKRSPLIVFIDDLQWGDVPGANVLADLIVSKTNVKILLILAYRDELNVGNECLKSLQLHRLESLDSDALLGKKPRTEQSFAQCKIALGPLSTVDAALLASNLLSANQLFSERLPLDDESSLLDNPLARALPGFIAGESGGMPFYVQELVRHAMGAQLSTGSTSLQSDSASLSLSSVLRDRVQSLSETARQLVSMVAVAGQPVAIELVCEAIGAPSVDERQLHDLRVNRWLRSDRDTYQNTVTIFHDRIRESIVTSLPTEHRHQLHRQLAASLEQANATAETLAYHFDAGNQPQRAYHFLKLAGSNAVQVFAFEKAIDHYRRALELSSAHDDNYQLMRALGDAISQAGRGGEAAAAYLQAAEHAPAAEALELRLAAARQYCISGYTDEGRLLVRSVLASNGMYFPKRFLSLVVSLIYQRIRLSLQGLKSKLHAEEAVPQEKLQRIDMMWSAVSGLSFQEPVAVAALHSYGLRAALEVGEPKRLARAVALESILSATSGGKSHKRVQSLLQLTDKLASSTNDIDTQGMLQLARGGTAFLQVCMPDAVAPLIEAERLFSSRVPKAWWELTTARSLLAWAYMHLGDFRSLKQCIDLYEQDAQARGDRFLLSSISSAGIPQLQLAAGQPELAQAGLDLLEESIPYEQFQQRHTSMLYSQAQIDLYRGDGLPSWQRIHANWSLFRKSMQVHNQFARVSLIDLRARCGLLEFNRSRDRRLLRSVIGDTKRLEREAGAWVQAYVLRLQALIHVAQSQLDEAQNKLSQATDAFERIGFLSCAAAARRRHGQLMGDTNGKQLVEQAELFFRGQSIVDPEAFQRVLF